MKGNIRFLYLYLISAIGLFIAVIGLIRLLDLGIKVYVFNNADRYEYSQRPYPLPEDKTGTAMTPEELRQIEEENQRIQEIENNRQRQRTVAEALAMIVVGFPLYLYHWKIIQKENK